VLLFGVKVKCLQEPTIKSGSMFFGHGSGGISALVGKIEGVYLPCFRAWILYFYRALW